MPARLSSVLVADSVLQRLNEPMLASAKRVFVVGSMIGGTGGGLIVPVLAKLQALCGPETSLFCIALGEYFKPDEGVLDNAVTRFRSNWLMTRSLLEKSVPKLWKYSFIEQPKLEKKVPFPETDAPFPTEQNPFWRAIVTYKHLAEDTTMDRGHDFASNAVDWETARSALSYAAATQCIDNARAQISILQEYSPLVSYCQEPFPAACWGKFSEFASAIIALHKKGRKVDANPREFLNSVQRQINSGLRLSVEHPSNYTLGLFPGRAVAALTPTSFRSLAWPELGPDPLAASFGSKDDSAISVAAATSYCAARLSSSAGVL